MEERWSKNGGNLKWREKCGRKYGGKRRGKWREKSEITSYFGVTLPYKSTILTMIGWW